MAGNLSPCEPLAAALLSTILLGAHLAPVEWATWATILAGLVLTGPGVVLTVRR